VWSIRAKLQLEGRTRDLALFNLAIDSKLRGCDLVALRVEDVAPNGYAIDRANVRQRKTGRPVRFELTEQTRQSLDDYLRMSGRKPGHYLFPGRGGTDRWLTTHQYARLVSDWVSGIGLDPLKYATHSIVLLMLMRQIAVFYGLLDVPRARRTPAPFCKYAHRILFALLPPGGECAGVEDVGTLPRVAQ
jgi:hypothetical protein